MRLFGCSNSYRFVVSTKRYSAERKRIQHCLRFCVSNDDVVDRDADVDLLKFRRLTCLLRSLQVSLESNSVDRFTRHIGSGLLRRFHASHESGDVLNAPINKIVWKILRYRQLES